MEELVDGKDDEEDLGLERPGGPDEVEAMSGAKAQRTKGIG